MIVLPTKIINQTISVDTKTTKLTLDSTIRSYDNQDTIIKLTLTSELDLDFNNATAKAAIEYYADKKYVVETSANVSDNTLSFALPTNLKGYDGYAIIGVYVDLADGSKIDIKDLVVKCEPSIIDKAAVDAQPYYFSNLDSVLIEFKQYASSKADELDNDVISAKQEIADKVASVDSESAIETITSKVADVDSHATTTKSDMDTRLADVNSYATDTLTNVNNVATKAKADIANLVANAHTNVDKASQQVNDYATSTKADMDTAKTSIDDYAITQKSTIDKTVADVNTHATTQKQVINSVVSDVQSVGDTAKEDIKATLPTLQGQVSQLSESITEISDYVDMPYSKSNVLPVQYAMQTYIDSIPMKQNKQYAIKASIENATTQNIYVYLRDSSDTQLDALNIVSGETEKEITYSCTQDIMAKVEARVSSVIIAGTPVKIEVKEVRSKGENLGEVVDKITGYKKVNLIPVPFKNMSGNGLTWTLNDDWTVHIHGIATALSYQSISFVLPVGTYILSGLDKNATTETYEYYFDNHEIVKDYTFTVTEEKSYRLLIRVKKSDANINTVIKPMIRESSVLNDTYCKYGEYQIYKPIQELIDYSEFNWSGKKMNVLGDSIVQGSYGNFVSVIKNILHLSEARNYGVGGSLIASSDVDSTLPPACIRYVNMDDDADIVIVHAGTNDYSAQIPLGESESTDIKTFNGALNTLMDGLREKYPTALIIFSNILHRFNDNANTIKASQYRACIENRCLAKHMVFYDGYKYTGFDFVKGYYDHILTVDGLHPNQKGAEILGRKLAGFIRWN